LNGHRDCGKSSSEHVVIGEHQGKSDNETETTSGQHIDPVVKATVNRGDC
jgi:hypothetical protein